MTETLIRILVSLAAIALCVVIAQRCQADVEYVTGFETWDAEQGTEVEGASGTISFDAASKRTGNVGMSITTAAAEQTAYYLDLSDFTATTDYAAVRFYVYIDPSVLSDGDSSVIAYISQDTGETDPGCMAVLSRSGDSFSLRVDYLGGLTSPVTFGAVTIGSGWQDIAISQDNVDSDTVTCSLYSGNGQLRFNTAQDLSTTTADVKRVYFGSTAESGLPNDAMVLLYDDVVIDDQTEPGPGYVYPLHASGSSSHTWSSVPAGCGGGETSPQGCVDDWEVGAYNSCTSSSAGNWREKETGSGEDVFIMDNIPTLDASDTIESVSTIHRACNNHGSGGNAKINPRLTISATDYDGTEIDIADGASAWMPGLWLQNPNTTADWTESDVNNLLAGSYKSTNTSPNNGDPSVTAFLVYVDVRTPGTFADRRLLDLAGTGSCLFGVCDGVIVWCAGGDSISAGTGASVCTGGTCRSSCSVDGDCTALGSGSPDLEDPGCVNLTCAVPCNTSDDCDNCGGTCPSARQYVRRTANETPDLDTVWNCAISGSTSEDIEQDLTDCVSDPLSCSTCTLIKGNAGTCSEDGVTTCTSDADCSGTCDSYPCDYVTAVYGINNTSSMTPAPAAFNRYTTGRAWVNVSHFDERTAPLAMVAPTGYACQRTTCTTNGDCTAALGAGSTCQDACVGHTDPVWPCDDSAGTGDVLCGECATDSTRFCIDRVNNCSIGGTSTCTAGTCGTGTKYCTCPEYSTCSTDSDCGATSGMEGVCVSGTCAFSAVDDWSKITQRVCIDGTNDDTNCDDDTDCTGGGRCVIDPKRMTVFERRYNQLGHDHRSIWADGQGMESAVEATGARFIHLTNITQTEDIGFLKGAESTRIATDRLRKLQLGQAEYVVDMHQPAQWNDNRNRDDSVHGILRTDRWHPNEAGSGVMKDAMKGWFDTATPVCSFDGETPCAACVVPCTTADDCQNGGAGATCVAGNCVCATDADCGPTGYCGSYFGVGAYRCYYTDFDTDCPAGNGASARSGLADDTKCPTAQNKCTHQRTHPRCTDDGSTTCTTTADCNGVAYGSVCAVDAAWIRCDHDGMCRDGGPWPDDVCADNVCQQPTPTPTP